MISMPEMKPLFMDIETTGLDPKTCRITMVGFMSQTGFTTFYAKEDEEGDLLDNIDNLLSNLPTDQLLITYNGISFDLPFIRKRHELIHKEPSRIPEDIPHLDLMLIAKERMNKGRWMAKDFCCRTILPLYFRNSSGLRCAVLENLPPEKVYSFEKYELMYHNSVDLVQTALIYEEFKRYGWLDDGDRKQRNSDR